MSYLYQLQLHRQDDFLHGVLDHPQSMVLTDDDYLDFLSSVFIKGFIILPSLIQGVLSSNLLLFIGYSLEDIDFQLILRILSGLTVNRGWPVMYRDNIPKEKADQAVRYMEESMKQLFSVNVFYGRAEDFAHEALRRWERFRIEDSAPTELLEPPNNYTGIQNKTTVFSNTISSPYDIGPYIGPRPFNRDLKDQRLFFGRNYEIEKIVPHIQANPLLHELF